MNHIKTLANEFNFLLTWCLNNKTIMLFFWILICLSYLSTFNHMHLDLIHCIENWVSSWWIVLFWPGISENGTPGLQFHVLGWEEFSTDQLLAPCILNLLLSNCWWTSSASYLQCTLVTTSSSELLFHDFNWVSTVGSRSIPGNHSHTRATSNNLTGIHAHMTH